MPRGNLNNGLNPRLLPIDNRARVIVRLPADAVLWFDGEAMTPTGPEREFVTPQLPLDKAYVYEVRARWMQSGQPVERTLEVKVRRNTTTTADFSVPPPPRD